MHYILWWAIYFKALCVSFPTTYQREGLAMRLGLGRVFARLDEPEGDEPRVSRLGSNSSISSTSSWSSTSWSRMHLTEYWPNTPSYTKTEKSAEKEEMLLKIKQEWSCWFHCQHSFLFPIWPTSCWPSLRDAAAWWIGLHLHKASASLHKRPPCKWHTAFEFYAGLWRILCPDAAPVDQYSWNILQIKILNDPPAPSFSHSPSLGSFPRNHIIH